MMRIGTGSGSRTALMRKRVARACIGVQRDMISDDIGPERREALKQARTLRFVEFPANDGHVDILGFSPRGTNVRASRW